MDQCRQVYCRVVRIVGVQIVSLFLKKLRESVLSGLLYIHIKKKDYCVL